MTMQADAVDAVADDVVNVLVVDDRQENLVATQAVLEPLGQRIVLASSGDDALRCLLSDEFAVILLDVQMPGIDGFETALRIKERERTRHVPIIFLTALSREQQHTLRGYWAGAVDYIHKPIDPVVLRAKVSVFVELARKTREIERQREELALRTRALERSNADLAQFSYMASHDLQEPLRVVAGYLELLGRPDALADGDAGAWVGRALDATKRMSQLIQDLLQLARVTSNQEELRPVDLDALARAALDDLAVAIRESGAEVRTEHLPVVLAREACLRQVLQNLVANAIKFRGEQPLLVHLGARRDEGQWVVSVTDNGIGIPAERRETVFDMFDRGDRSRPGSGIGLALCRSVIERCGGRIWAEAAEDGGTAVSFTLPAP